MLGLAAGVGLPDLAAVMKPYLPHMVATTLFLAALRIGPQQAIGKLRDLRDIIPIYPIIGFFAGAIDWLFVNPWYFWTNDAWTNRGTTYEPTFSDYDASSGPKDTWRPKSRWDRH